MKNNSKILRILKIWKIILFILIIILILFLVKLWYYKKYQYVYPWEIMHEEEIKANNQRIENHTDRRIKGSELKDFLSQISIAVSTSDRPTQISITIKPKEDNKPNTLDNDFPIIDKINDDKQKEEYLNKIHKLMENVISTDMFKITATKKDERGLIIEITIEDADN